MALFAELGGMGRVDRRVRRERVGVSSMAVPSNVLFSSSSPVESVFLKFYQPIEPYTYVKIE